jgi:hypothetical protein
LTRSPAGLYLAAQVYHGTGGHDPAVLRAAERYSEWLASCPPGLPDGSGGVLHTIISNQEMIMTGLTDLQANITAMQAEWTTFLADMTTALANEDPDAAVESAAQLVAQQTAAMQAADPVTGTAAASAEAASAPAAAPAG